MAFSPVSLSHLPLPPLTKTQMISFMTHWIAQENPASQATQYDRICKEGLRRMTVLGVRMWASPGACLFLTHPSQPLLPLPTNPPLDKAASENASHTFPELLKRY